MLQVLMQGVLETIILQDRRQYLEERGFESGLVAVFDESISPRNIAIVASKIAPSK